jgi:head-tail adaptor
MQAQPLTFSMHFNSDSQYIDICIDYAHSYSEKELSLAFSTIVKKISNRYPNSKTEPVKLELPFNEVQLLPTNIEDGLWWHFKSITRSWPEKKFSEYFQQVKSEMTKGYIPFRLFEECDFEDAMRLRVLQDSMNIIAGRKIDVNCKTKYSRTRYFINLALKKSKPSI